MCGIVGICEFLVSLFFLRSCVFVCTQPLFVYLRLHSVVTGCHCAAHDKELSPEKQWHQPVFASLAFFEFGTGQRVTENFIFDFNPPEISNLLDRVCGSFLALIFSICLRATISHGKWHPSLCFTPQHNPREPWFASASVTVASSLSFVFSKCFLAMRTNLQTRLSALIDM